MQIRCTNCCELYEEVLGMCPHCGFVRGDHAEELNHMDPGTIVNNRYIIGRVLGYGGFGVTYLAWDQMMEIKVAIKEYLPSEFATRAVGITQVSVFQGKKEEQFASGMERFVDEAKKLAKFADEEGIVRIYDSFFENQTAYIVMEYLDGITLKTLLEQNKRLNPDVAIGLMTPIMKSLEHIHQEGIIHRDVAPDNIIITKDGRSKLIDFGASRFATTSHSRSLTVLIKPGFSPEEQYRSDGRQGPYTDVYSVSAVLYKMITGVEELPDSFNRRAEMENGKKDELIPPGQYVEGLEDNIEIAIMNALNVRIEDRTPTMERFLEELTSEERVKRVGGRIRKNIDPRRWPLFAKIIVPTCFVTVVTLLLLLITGVIHFDSGLVRDITIQDGMNRVPYVVNSIYGNAEQRMKEANLIASISEYRYSNLVMENLVMSQSEAAGSIIPNNTKVSLVVSKGVEQVEVPNVIGDESDSAVEEMENIGLLTVLTYSYHETVAEGYVLSQSVDPGTMVEKDTLVALDISLGRNPDVAYETKLVTVPNFVDMQYEDAVKLATKNDILVKVVAKEYSDKEDGIVLAQSIQAGEEIINDNVVEFTISLGAQVFRVPDVIGEKLESAEKILTDAGYLFEYKEVQNDLYEEGMVFEQTPQKGDELEQGEIVYLTVSSGSKSFAMPDLVGMTLKKAETELSNNRLTYVANYVVDQSVPANQILKQEPEAGTTVRAGTQVVLTISTKQATITVPNVINMSKSEAEHLLKNAGFKVTFSESNSNTIDRDCVMTQSLNSGSEQLKGTTIALTISSGKEKISVPNVVGKSITIGTDILSNQGLVISQKTEFSDEVPANIIISQSVNPGTTIEFGSTIELIASKGAAPVSVPNVVGDTKDNAMTKLQSKNLLSSITEQYSDSVASGHVISQSPVSGASVQKNSKVQLIVSKGPASISVNSISLNQTSADIIEGGKLQLMCKVSPENASDISVVYSSSKTSIATVSASGLVTALSEGSAIITATSNSGKKTATCIISVKKAEITSIEISSQARKTSYYVGDSLNTNGLKIKVTYNNGKTEYISEGFQCSADLSSAGTKKVTVTLDKGLTTTYDISVLTPTINLDSNSISMFIGDSYLLGASSAPSSASIGWKSSNSACVSVNNGMLTAKGVGSSNITASITYKGKTYQDICNVTVSDVGIVLNEGKISLYTGDVYQLSAATNPSSKSITWSTNNSSIATVSSNGLVTAGGVEGTTDIIATFTYAGITYKSTCSVTVSKPYVKLSNSSITMYIGESKTIGTTVLPSSQSIKWSSSNTSVATVNDGLITAGTSTGSANITASFIYSGKTYSETCMVTVKTPTVDVSLNNWSSYVGDTKTITATISPTSGGTISWSSSNTSIVSLSSTSGTSVTMTLKGTGSAIVTATYTYGGKTYTSSCKISSTTPSISTNVTNWNANVGDTKTITATISPTSGGTVSWSSSNTSVVSLSSTSGTSVTMTAKGAGSATVTATYTYGGKKYYSKCSVNVVKKVTSISASTSSVTMQQRVSGIAFNQTSQSINIADGMNIGWSYNTTFDNQKITFTTNSDASDSSLTVTSSNTSVVKVSTSKSGNVTTVTLTAVSGNYGTSNTATITAKANDGSGKTASVSVTVNTLKQQGSSDVRYSSSNQNIVYISSDASMGWGASSGTAVMTITHVATGLSATKTITVNNQFAGYNAIVTYSSGLIIRSNHSTDSAEVHRVSAGVPLAIFDVFYDGTRIWGYHEFSSAQWGWYSMYYAPNTQWNVDFDEI